MIAVSPLVCSKSLNRGAQCECRPEHSGFLSGSSTQLPTQAVGSVYVSECALLTNVPGMFLIPGPPFANSSPTSSPTQGKPSGNGFQLWLTRSYFKKHILHCDPWINVHHTEQGSGNGGYHCDSTCSLLFLVLRECWPINCILGTMIGSCLRKYRECLRSKCCTGKNEQLSIKP